MSLQLLNYLNGNKNGGLKNFINKYESKSEPRICWYPSAGEDFRALLYLHSSYAKIYPSSKKEPLPPDIFLFTDYFPWTNSRFLDTKTIFVDDWTCISVDTIEELPPLNTLLNPEILDFTNISTVTNKVLFLSIKVLSNTLGEFTFPVIYAFVENETFCATKLIPNYAIISHIIHNRYGGGLGGGGKASGVWMLNVLKKLKCEVFITDEHYYWPEGDNFAIERYPILNENAAPELENIRIIESQKWSNHGDVNWNLVL